MYIIAFFFMSDTKFPVLDNNQQWLSDTWTGNIYS